LGIPANLGNFADFYFVPHNAGPVVFYGGLKLDKYAYQIAADFTGGCKVTQPGNAGLFSTPTRQKYFQQVVKVNGFILLVVYS